MVSLRTCPSSLVLQPFSSDAEPFRALGTPVAAEQRQWRWGGGGRRPRWKASVGGGGGGGTDASGRSDDGDGRSTGSTTITQWWLMRK